MLDDLLIRQIIGESRHHDNIGVIRLPHYPRQLYAILPRHPYIGYHHIDTLALEHLLRFHRIPGGQAVISLALEQDLKQLLYVDVVIVFVRLV